MPSVYLNRLAYHLPEGELTNEAIVASFPEWSVDKISRKTGIYSRRIAGADETSGDLAFGAAEALFAQPGAPTRESVDFVLLCTQSPDYFLPTTACILQDRLGIPTTAGALDFNLGCSGYVYGLGLAKGLVASGQAERVLLLTGETYSKFVGAEDKSARTIFGDGASASIISGTAEGYELGAFAYGSDGSGFDKLIVRAGGMRRPAPSGEVVEDEYDNRHTDADLYMDGPGIFAFTLDGVPTILSRVLEKAELGDGEVGKYVFHQANAFMLNHLRKKLGIPAERFVIEMGDCGNTVSATIPIALARSEADAPVAPGQAIALVGFGVGLSLAACTLTAV